MSKKKKKPLRQVSNFAKSDNWIYFRHDHNPGNIALYKSRPNGSEQTIFVKPDDGSTWSKLGNILVTDNWVYFDVTEEYSTFDEYHQEYSRYCDEVEYKIMKNGENLTRTAKRHGSLGSSN